MRLVMTLLVRDEADVIADMLSYHRQAGVDHVVAMDNASTDGTTEILRGFAESGWLTLLHEPSDAYRQDVWQSELVRAAAHLRGADWILCSDADEFWMPPEGRTLKETVAAGGADGADMLSCGRVNLLGAAGPGPWRDRLVHTPAEPRPLRWGNPMRDPLPDPFFYYGVPDKVILRAEGVVRVGRGAHLAIYDRPTQTASCEVRVHHVPVRDKEEFARSVARIGTAVRSDPALDQRVSGKYRRWLAMTEGTGSIDAAWGEVMPDAERVRADTASGVLVEDTRLRDVAIPAAPAPVPPPPDRARSDLSLAEVALLVGLHPAHTDGIAGPMRRAAGLPNRPASAWRGADLALLHRQIAMDPPPDPEGPGADRLRVDLLDRLLAEAPGAARLVAAPPAAAPALPLWRALRRTAGLDLRVGLVFADPVRAAVELRRDHGLPLEIGMLVWLHHAISMEQGSRGVPRAFLALPPEGGPLAPLAERMRRALDLGGIPVEPGGQETARETARADVHAARTVPAICKHMLSLLDATARSDTQDAFHADFDGLAARAAPLLSFFPGLESHGLSSYRG